MPRNGAGSYSLPAGSTITNGDVSDASDLNTPLADIAADLNAARPIVAGGTGATSASAARTNLGLAIGTNVQAYDATLTSLAALGTAADRLAYTTGVDAWAETTLTAFGRSLIDDADAAAARTTLGLGAAATAGFLDEDNMTSDSATAAPSQQSVKAYVDAKVAAVELPPKQAWGRFNGSSFSEISSVGCSITSLGSNKYQITFDTARADTSYSAVATAKEKNDATDDSARIARIYDYQTTGFKIAITNAGSTSVGADLVSFIAVGG